LLVAMGNAAQVDATPELRTQMARHAQSMSVSELLGVIQAFNRAASEIRTGWQPALPLEIAFVEAISPDHTVTENTITTAPPSVRAAAATPKSQTSNEPGNAPRAGKETRLSADSEQEITPEDAITNQRLDKSWNLVLSQLKGQNPSLYGLVNSVKSRRLRGNTLTLGLNGDALKSRLEDPANLELLQKVLTQVMGKEIYVQVVLTSGSKNKPPDEVDNDGMVASALRDLGGEIVDIQ
jgi:DNA polymerase III gamma/tau subunit